MNTETYNKIINKMASNNKLEYNYAKLAEELFELGEICMKTLNKKPEKQPPIAKLIEEMGDVLVRCKVLARSLNISEQVNERAHQKALELDGYMEEGKYKGGI